MAKKTSKKTTPAAPKSDPETPTIVIKRVRIADLVMDPQNANTHPDDNLQAIGKSMAAFGQVEPLVVQKGTMKVIGGNGRLTVLQRKGDTHVDIHELDISDEKATALGIALNHSAKTSVWDNETLAKLVMSLPEELQDATGMDAEAMKKLLEEPETHEDDAPEPLPDAVSKLGDLWLLGEHKLLCGSCTEPKDVQRLMGEERAILFATDPPYLVGYSGANHNPHRGSNSKKPRNKDHSETYGPNWDDADLSRNKDLYDNFIRTAQQHAIREDAAWYCWHASRRQVMLEDAWTKAGALVHQQVIWVKSRPVLTRSTMLWAHEPCFVGFKKGQKVPIYQKTGMMPEQHEPAFHGWKQGNKPPIYQRLGDYVSTVWQIPSKEIENDEHPTSKPVRIFGIPMELHTLPGEICYEPFSGSGSQISAGEQLGRKVRALEIEPRYVDVAVRRWQTLTGLEATHSETGKTWKETAKQRKVSIP